MGILDFLRRKGKTVTTPKIDTATPTVPESERKFYQPDSYYTDVVAKGTVFERRVITFEERKKTAIPSRRGLYPAEILLLEYCSKGIYPDPKNGYPGFWWFTYGIRNVGAALKALEGRGYITLGPIKDSINRFTVAQLKDLLSTHGQSTFGKKAELVERVTATVSEADLLSAGAKAKYVLTEIGRLELIENAYVPYMHRAPNTTVENVGFGMAFNVWSINKLLGNGDKSNWKTIVDEQERRLNKETSDRNASFMRNLKKTDPEKYWKLRARDQQLAAVQKAKDLYTKNEDLDAYITFWEMVWSNGGLLFEGARWHFELPDLYIKAKRYDEALAFAHKLKRNKPTYADKADAYIRRIGELQAKLTVSQKAR